jgi:hypothetical protein
MSENPSQRRSELLEHRAANVLNHVMATALALVVISFSLWSFFREMGPAIAIYRGLPEPSKHTLTAALRSFVFVLICLQLSWSGLRRMMAKRRQ